jgi:hypothetical protein
MRSGLREIGLVVELGFEADCPHSIVSMGEAAKKRIRSALAAILENGQIPAVHGVVRWRIVELCQWIFEEFRICGLPADAEPGAAQDGIS